MVRGKTRALESRCRYCTRVQIRHGNRIEYCTITYRKIKNEQEIRSSSAVCDQRDVNASVGNSRRRTCSRVYSSQSRVSKDRFRARLADVTGRGRYRYTTRNDESSNKNDDNSWRTVATRKIFDYKPRRPLRTTADIELETSGGPRRPPRRVSPTAVIRRKPFSCRPAA